MTYQSPAPEHGITATGMYVVTEKMLQKIELESGVLLDSLRSRPAQQPDALAELANMVSERIRELKSLSNSVPEKRCSYLALIGENQWFSAEIARLRVERK